jgi:ABC-type polysaccharide/polyol phosphate transport system ATPase subunit
MAAPAVKVVGAGKWYRLGSEMSHGALLYEKLGGMLRVPFRRARHRRSADGGDPGEEGIWAVRDVSFELHKGEALGLIGRNGAGKSTLLKLLSRITLPTHGRLELRGRIATLLEVGTGFHPELTGRENVYLNGAILGMSRSDITRRFEDIIAFAGVERFVETPVKRYSSGMYLRLAFAVAAHLEPDILVVDEVLAVGDAEFQSKCLRRMESVEREGRTVVFVSHNLDAINRLCQQAVWLDGGKVAAVGPAHEVIDAYLGAQVSRDFAAREHQEGPIALEDVTVTDLAGRSLDVFRRDRPFVLEMRYTIRTPVSGLDLTAALLNTRGVEVLNEHWSDTCPERIGDPGRYVARLEVPAILNAGDYVVAVWFGTAYETFIWEAAVRRFRLEGDVKTRPHRAIALGLPWQVEPSNESPRPPTPRYGSASAEWAPHSDQGLE